MRKIKAVLFNGPPRSGKDTAAAWLNESLILHLESLGYMPFHRRMAEFLKLSAHALFGEPALHAEAFDHCKDEPSPIFHGHTPRQIYIWLSEEFAKRRFGQNFFGKVYCHFIQQLIYEELLNTPYHGLIIASDLGFDGEAEEIAKLIGAENIMIVHIHRKGCDFTNDSRSYIRLEGAAMAHLVNNDLTAFQLESWRLIRTWLGYDGVLKVKKQYA